MIDESCEELAVVIENLQQEMISCGLKNGLTNDKTLRISQMLDIQITKYQALKLKASHKS